MNVLRGLGIQGLILNTEDNFNSIPGLKLWLDGRQGVTKDISGNVSLWADKSSVGNNFYQNRAVRQPSNASSLWLDSTRIDNSEFLISNRRDYKFMHNNSPFAIYNIIKMKLADSPGGFTLMTTAGNSTNGFRLLLSAAGSGRMTTNTYVGGSSVRQLITSNLSLTYPNEVIVALKYIYKGPGIANNLVNQFGTVIHTGTTAVNTSSNALSDNFFILGNGNTGKSLKMGLVLLYDWTGYSEAQINGFDSRIMTLLNREKLIFENLDL